MKLTILGSGNSLPNKDRNAPGYLLEADNKLIMLDAGEGTKRQIVKAGYDLFRLTDILITHTHVDHVAELPAILFPFTWRGNRSNKINIFGPPKFKQFYRQAMSAFIPAIDSDKSKIKAVVKEVKNSNFKIGKLSVQSHLMKAEKPAHTFSPYAIGYRITYKNKTLVYCGDSDIASRDDIIKLAKGCDLLIIDSTLTKPSPGHLTSWQAGQIGQAATVKKLILTHLDSTANKRKINIKQLAAKYYKGPIILAKDLMQIKV